MQTQQLQKQALALIVATLLLFVSAVVYVLYARGAFEKTQSLVLISDDSEGVSVGMPLTFAGFNLGRVQKIELSAEGNARILVGVPMSNAQWLRTSSIFTLEKSLVGGARLRAFSGILEDPPLEDGAIRTVLRGDASADVPRIAGAARVLLENLAAQTDRQSALAATLQNLQVATDRLAGPQGALGLLAGNARTLTQVNRALEQTSQLLASSNQLMTNANQQVFGQGQTLTKAADGQTQGTVQQMNLALAEAQKLLQEARNSLNQMNLVLAEAQAVAQNTRLATEDLTLLRQDVESNLKTVEEMMQTLQQRWPFSRDSQLQLP
jgi:phospholipid/cholesterol/gamma-HCH transport system substrate-binding protein